MSQQINLFNPIFLKQKKYFSALTMVEALGVILAGCALLVAYADVQLQIRSEQAASTEAQLLRTKEQLISITAQFAPQRNNQALDDQIHETESEIKAMQRVFDSLQSGEFGDTKGYSGYFRAFSRQIIDGLWLTGISIYGAGRDISLSGRALNPQLVPAYLARLKRESEMQGKSFAALDMKVPMIDAPATSGSSATKASVAAPYVEFNLQSGADADTIATTGAGGK